MSKHLYMHTLDGRPAYFHDDGRHSAIVFAELRDHWEDEYNVVVLRESVEQIREDQRKHTAFRERHGWEVGKLDFVIVGLTPAVIPWQPRHAVRSRT